MSRKLAALERSIASRYLVFNETHIVISEIKQKYWLPLENCHGRAAWDALDARYSEPHRAYHTWDHIGELLERLDEFSRLATRPDLIATAIFWHDSVYMTRDLDGNRRPDCRNVRESAELFASFTLMDAATADAVQELIMATANHLHATASKEHYPGFSSDLDLFVGLDLSPLAAPWSSFVANFEKIRFEYSWVPDAMFYSGQLAFLESFARDESRLFRCAEMRQKWLRIAAANLSRCLIEMGKRPERYAASEVAA